MSASSKWPVVPFADVVQETKYGTASKANEQGVGIPVVRMNNITYQGALDLSEIKHVELSRRDSQEYLLRSGDLLFNRTNSPELVGKMCVWSSHLTCVFAGYLVRIRLKRDIADPNFVAAWFNTGWMKDLLRTRAKPSINMSNINANEVLAFPLILPPLTEQKRIAEILDRAEALRAKRRAVLAQLDTLTQSVFLEMFGDPVRNPKGWPCVPLADLSCKFSDGPFGSNLKTEHYVENGVRVIRLQNIGVAEFINKDRAFISENHFAKLKKHECRTGDVLVGTLGEPNLRACLQPAELPVALNKADCVQIRAKEATATSAFICALLNLPATERMAHDLMQGQTRIRISMGRLRRLRVPAPPFVLQNEFARHSAAVEKLKGAHRKALEELDALFASLQHRAFRGEL